MLQPKFDFNRRRSVREIYYIDTCILMAVQYVRCWLKGQRSTMTFCIYTLLPLFNILDTRVSD